MKLLLLAALFAALFTSLLMSCNKANDSYNPPNIETSFDVEAQVNVSKYVIQTSPDGHVYSDKVSIKADNSVLSKTYTSQFYQSGTGHIYVRVKSVDIDGAVDYSPITTIFLN